MNLSSDKEALLEKITADLISIDGVKAIVLGGSYATGLATNESDLDIGIYYSQDQPFRIEDVKAVAEKHAANDMPTVTGYYAWGKWVNGGAWIKTAICKVDFLYKNIEQISRTIENAIEGIWENDFEQQPPYGFSSIIFLAESKFNLPLYDPDNIIEKLKEDVAQYPQKLKQSVIQQSLWSAEFTIWQAAAFAAKADLYNSLGCLTRATKNIVHALFAINERYPIGDKMAIEIIEQSEIKPADWTNRINEILSCEKKSLQENVENLKSLFNETVGLANGQYKPYYKLD